MEPCKAMGKTVEAGDRNQHSRGEDSPKGGVLGLVPHCSVFWGDGAGDRCLIEPHVRALPQSLERGQPSEQAQLSEALTCV